MLLDNGADINTRGGFFASAFQAAARKLWHIDFFGRLIRMGADVNMQSRDYGTARIAACSTGSETAAKVLVKGSADVNVPGGKVRGNALQVTSAEGYGSLVMMLLEKKADPKTQPRKPRWTTLQVTSHKHHHNEVRILLEKGAYINIRDDNTWDSHVQGRAITILNERRRGRRSRQ